MSGPAVTARPGAPGAPFPPPSAEAPSGISDGEFRLLSRILHQESGITLSDTKKDLVVSRLSRRLRDLGLSSFRSYCDHLNGPEGQQERGVLISALTTNVTSFFREAHHFKTLREEILPPLIAAAMRGRRVRLWSAGCSTGEEAYSLGITLLDLCPEAQRHDIRILATDIDPQVVATARAGAYSETALKGMQAATRRRYFTPGDGERMEAGAALRGIIHFDVLNLIGTWPMRGLFDVIFCRNVVIYFDEATRAGLWQRFAAVLQPAGSLFIGHSERIDPSASRMFESAGLTRYRRSGQPRPPQPPAAARIAAPPQDRKIIFAGEGG